VGDVPPAAVIVLAAGAGTRMRSALPKVLHEIAGRPLIGHVLSAVQPLQARRTLVVVGAGREQVEAALPGYAEPVVQAEQKGTGHATRLALDALAASDTDEATVVVLLGDTPLLTPGTLQALLAEHVATGAVATMLTAVAADPSGYGRVLRSADAGSVTGVVEHRDATSEQLTIREVAAGVYAFAGGPLRTALANLGSDTAQGEEYLPDVVNAYLAAGLPVAAVTTDEREIAGVNDRVQLAAAGRALNDRLVEAHLRAGVTVVDPRTTWIGADVELEPDVVLLPGTSLTGATRVATGARIGPDTSLSATVVEAGATVVRSHCDGAVIGPEVTVGPYSYLRPGTRLRRGAKVGAFVEVKSSEIGEQAKVPHLSYVGDAVIGARSNIGAATVVLNYDGVEKHRTVIGEDVRVGGDTMLVAPVEIGSGAYTAAGSVITQDVPAGAMAVSRARQRNIEGWVERRRPGSPAARAAARARHNGSPEPAAGPTGSNDPEGGA